MKRIVAVLAMTVVWTQGAFVAHAEEDPDLVFLQETNGALSRCESLVRMQALNKRLYGLEAPIMSGEIADCTNEGRERLKRAHQTYVATSPTPPSSEKARDLYLAALAYADAIDSADEPDQLRSGTEASTRNRARADFVAETGL